jgi:hypothetical protein
LRVALGGGSNNSARTLCSVCGACIRLAGAGGSFGHSGLTALPLPAQAQSTSAQVIGNAIRNGLRILLSSLVFDGDLIGQVGFLGLGLARLLARLRCCGRTLSLVLGGHPSHCGIAMLELPPIEADTRNQCQCEVQARHSLSFPIHHPTNRTPASARTIAPNNWPRIVMGCGCSGC